MSEERDMINEVPGSSPEFRTELAEQLAELAPEAIADGKIDVEKLKELLEGDASDTSERFGLFWPGKKRAMRAAQTPTTATLRPDKENSKDWDTTKNVFIEGDNLEVLKILQKHYHGKIKMIYIDPPYNTGKDFVYPDNYKEGLETYLEWSKQVNEEGKKLSSNSESEGRYHSNWLNMMYPRLKLARNLLTDDGVIFISIDDNESDHLKKISDEIFGEANHVNTFVWVNNLKGRQISGYGAAGTKEYIFAYARNSKQVGEFIGPGRTLKELMPSIYKGFNYKTEHDDYGPYVVKNELYNTNSAFNEETRPNLVYDIYYNPSSKEIKTENISETHLHEGFIKIPPKRNNNGTHLFHANRWSRKKVSEEGHNLFFTNTSTGWKVYTKVRNVDTTTMKDVVMDITTSSGSTDINDLGLDKNWFDYPKPVDLVKLLAMVFTEEGDIVLDFFAGSGTTAHATFELNSEDFKDRSFIMVQLPEPLCKKSNAAQAGFKTIADISRVRIGKASDNVRESAQEQNNADLQRLDTGFRAYKLADTNFTKWRTDSDIDATQLEQHLLDLRESADDNATADDLLTEILLKQGHSLVEQIRDRDIDGLSYKAVVRADDEDGEEDTLVLAYLDEHIKPTLAQLRAAMEVKPAQFIMLEDAFQGDDELKTNLAQICKTNGIELWTA